MIYSFFDKISGPGIPCSTDMLMATIDSQKLRDNVQAVRDAVAADRKDDVARLKKRLPAVTWQAAFPDGKRCSERAVPSGLYMLDIDHVADASTEGQRLVTTVQNGPLKDLVAAIHISPSGRGLRVVAVCADPALDTIEKNQAWLAGQLGLSSYDSACKDFARLAFLVPQEDFLLLNLDLLAGDPLVKLNNDLCEAEPEGGTESMADLGGASTFAFHGMLISDIAEKYLDRIGRPQEGERNTFYYTMCTNFRHITDCNVGVMLAQLPDFGLSVNERQKVVESATKRYRGGRIPYPFWKFLESLGLVQSEHHRAEADDTSDATDDSLAIPPMPMLFREYCNRVSEEFRWPMTAALLPILGTMTTRLRADYDIGEPHSTTFHSVIVAPPSSGKSIIGKAYYELVDDFIKRDEVELKKEETYKRELKVKKNSAKLPERPITRLRLLSPTISVPKLLERQHDAGEIHQLTFTPEVDTLTKSNKGGRSMDKNDIYREAWDNDYHSQDYMMEETFSGHTRLFQNFLLTGTPKQVADCYGTAENGLVSRVMFAHIKGQEYAPKPQFAMMSDSTKERVNDIVSRLSGTCYCQNDDGTEGICPVKDITRNMAFIDKPIKNWLERRRLEAAAAADETMDNFRKRAAVKAFRAAMVAVAIYNFKPTAKQQHVISDWALWIADMDLREHLDMYADQYTPSATPVKKRTVNNMLHDLPDSFQSSELATLMEKAGKRSPISKVLCTWRKMGLIEDSGDLHVKTSLGKTL